MRTFLGVLAVSALVSGSGPASAEYDYPWCVHYSMEGEVTNCGFVSYEQCMMTARGMAGFCQRNPIFDASRPAAKPAAKRRTRN